MVVVFHCCCKNKNLRRWGIEEMRQLLIYFFFTMSCWLCGWFFSMIHTETAFLLCYLLFATWEGGLKISTALADESNADGGKWACKNCIHFTLSFLLTAGRSWWFCVTHSLVVIEPAKHWLMSFNSFAKHNCFALSAMILSQWFIWSNVCAMKPWKR